MVSGLQEPVHATSTACLTVLLTESFSMSNNTTSNFGGMSEVPVPVVGMHDSNGAEGSHAVASTTLVGVEENRWSQTAATSSPQRPPSIGGMRAIHGTGIVALADEPG